MTAISEETFRDRFRSLSPDERRELVAELWRAQGNDAVIDENFGIVVNDGESRIEVVDRSPTGFTRADHVVTPVDSTRCRSYAEANGASLHTPADLRNILLYKINRETADKISRSYFGAPIFEIDPTESHRTVVSKRQLLVIGVIAIVATSGLIVFGVGTIFDAPLEPNQEPAELSSIATDDEPASSLPPGVSDESVTDPDALVEAHRRYFSDRPHQVHLTFDGPATQSLFENTIHYEYSKSIVSNSYVTVSNRTVVRHGEAGLLNESVGEFRDGTSNINWRVDDADTIVFRNGTYVEPLFDPSSPHDPTDLYRAALTADSQEIDTIFDEEERYYRISVQGIPERLFEDTEIFNATMIVAPSGRLVELSIVYLDGNSGETVTLRVSYSLYQTKAVVRPPVWLDDIEGENTEL